MSPLEVNIHYAMEKLSNNEGGDLNVSPDQLDEWIDNAADYFREALKKQLTRKTEAPRLRMSNIGRPACQLQMALGGEKEVRKPYNHIFRMIHGDVTESIMEVILRIAGVNITGGKNKVELNVSNTTIRGEDDIVIDHKLYDIKSASPFAFNNKFKKGYDAMRSDDSFGYIGQLYGYTEAQEGIEAGGWIAVDKSSGEVVVVEADMNHVEKARIEASITETVKTIEEQRPFKRCFEPIDDTFGRKLTGLKRLCTACGFCDYVQKCWPNAEYKPHPNSKAMTKPHYWFVNED